MDIKTAKDMLNACYTAKRIRDLLPELPSGVSFFYINILDIIIHKEDNNEKVKVSDISDITGLTKPGITRAVKEMESKGYVTKTQSELDGRIVYISSTQSSRELFHKYDIEFFSKLVEVMDKVKSDDIDITVRTINQVYDLMSDSKITLN